MATEAQAVKKPKRVKKSSAQGPGRTGKAIAPVKALPSTPKRLKTGSDALPKAKVVQAPGVAPLPNAPKLKPAPSMRGVALPLTPKEKFSAKSDARAAKQKAALDTRGKTGSHYESTGSGALGRALNTAEARHASKTTNADKNASTGKKRAAALKALTALKKDNNASKNEAAAAKNLVRRKSMPNLPKAQPKARPTAAEKKAKRKSTGK